MIRLLCALVFPIFLSTSELYKLTAELQRVIEVLEMKCYRIILSIVYGDPIINIAVKYTVKQ